MMPLLNNPADASTPLKRIRLGDRVLGILGLLIWLVVCYYSYKQLSQNRISFAVSGISLTDDKREYVIKGFIRNSSYVSATPDTTAYQIDLVEKALPFIGRFYNENGQWKFRLTGDIAAKGNPSSRDWLLPVCLLNGSTDKQVNPGSIFTLKELTQNTLTFKNQDNFVKELEISAEYRNNIPLIHLSYIQNAPIDVLTQRNSYTVRVLDQEHYTLDCNDPQTILVLPKAVNGAGFEAKFRVQKINPSRYTVHNELTPDADPLILTAESNKFLWNGWQFEIKGMVGTSAIAGTFLFLFLLLAIGIYMYHTIVRKDRDLINAIETRVLRMALVYFIFSVISILYINHYLLPGNYERRGWVLYASILGGWLSFIILTALTQRKRFWEDKKHLPELFKLGNTLPVKVQYVIFILIIPALFVTLVLFFRENERVSIGAGFAIPIAHFTKLFVCYFIIKSRRNLFEGNWRYHLPFWIFLLILSIKSGDYGSLLFSFPSYLITSYLYKGEFKIRKNSYGFFTLVVVTITLTTAVFFNNDIFPDSLQSKVARFRFPFYNLESRSLALVGNGHKESQAKILWSIERLTGDAKWGLNTNLRTANFFTTWHTDHAFITGYLFGGIVFIAIFIILISYLLFDNNYLLSGLRKVVSERFISKLDQDTVLALKDKLYIKDFLTSYIHLFFLMIYQLVQTAYPALSCLNIVPLTGQAIPCLSISNVEAVLTPIVLWYLYTVVGRIFHNDYFIFKESIQAEDRIIYFQKLVKPLAARARRITLRIAFVILAGASMKIIYFDKKYLIQDDVILTYLPTPSYYMEDVVDETNKELRLRSGIQVQETLLNQAVNYIRKNSTLLPYEQKQVLKHVRRFIFQDAYRRRGNPVELGAGDGLVRFRRDSVDINRIFRNQVVNNMSYSTYFRPRSGGKLGDASLRQFTSVYDDGQLLAIRSDAIDYLSSKQPQFIKSSSGAGQLVYNSDSLYCFKYVNNTLQRVLIYDCVGDVDFNNNTVDIDLQAIINLYLKNFVQKNADQVKVASVMVAENSSGYIRTAASYPFMPNGSIGLKKSYIHDLRSEGLISYLDEYGAMNFCFADAMPGSVIKPLIAATALYVDKQIANQEYPDLNQQDQPVSFSDYIIHSNNAYSGQLLNSFYQKDSFRGAFARLFNLQVDQGNPAPSGTVMALSAGVLPISSSFLLSTSRRNDLTAFTRPLTDGQGNPVYDASIGQGDVRMSLASIVQSYCRINTGNRTALRFYKYRSDRLYETESYKLNRRFDPLYSAMTGVLTKGTAQPVIGVKLLQMGLNPEKFRAKTGTVQVEGGNRNKASYIIFCTATHTIGVSVLGDLADKGVAVHAKQVLADILPLLQAWRKHLYLTSNGTAP